METYFPELHAPIVLDIIIWVSALIRIIVCFLPQNNWCSDTGNMKLSMIRNGVFLITGIGVVMLYVISGNTYGYGMTRMVVAIIKNNKEENMNETLKVLETRRSCRSFDPEKMISEEDLHAIVKAGTYAATGMGKQSPIIIAVTNKELRDQLSKKNAKIMGADMDPFYGAPVILIVLADKSIGTYVYDGSLVMGNLMNAAESLGINSIWIHRAKEEFESEIGKKILADLGIEGEFEGIGHCALGYATAPLNAPVARKENYVYYIK